MNEETTKPKLSPYHWKLLMFLSVATFFEGYDSIALSQLLPNLRQDMGLSESQGGLLVAFISAGTIVAYILIRQADRIGRRAVLTLTIVGYTLFSFLTGLAPNIWVFAVCQLIARIFLIGEWVISTVYAAEEFPAHMRGFLIGIISAFGSLGSVACAGLVPLLISMPWGWRTVYFAGTAPLVILAFARRSLKETERFENLSEEERKPKPLFRIFGTPYRTRVFQLAMIWGFTYLCTQTAVTFWKEFAINERQMTDGDVATIVTIAALGAMPMVFLAGKLIDVLGRRKGAVIIYAITCASAVAAYTLESYWMLLGAVMGAIFGASAVSPLLNAYNTELFPTELRSEAFAWSNNLFGRIGYVSAPIAVGFAAESVGWGPAVACTAVGPAIALVLILKWLPETAGMELEQTAAITSPNGS